MQKYTTTSYFNDTDMIFIPSSLGGVIDFDKNDKFENMLTKIMVVPEYLRMKNIQQLGFVQNIIPSASHTRFLHCIGAFDLMRSTIYFSNRNFGKSRSKSLDFNLNEQAAQAAAFLHDIGHVFPGHPFERAIKKLFPEDYKNHEEWGVEIIRKSKIYNILDSYHSGFAEKVLKIMAEDDLDNNIWQQIHCGNLNVDTMDYINRDQSRIIKNYDNFLIRRIIENIKFGKTQDNKHCLMLCPGAEVDFIKMLNIRGEMYSNIYLNGIAASAEAYLEIFFKEIAKNLETRKYRKSILSVDNSYVKFINSKGTDLKSYLNLDVNEFVSLIQRISRLKINGLSEIADNYKYVSSNFSLNNIYVGNSDNSPDEVFINKEKEKIELSGGIFKDITVPLYNKNNPEVYCIINDPERPKKISEMYPDIINSKVRIISGYYMKGHKR